MEPEGFNADPHKNLLLIGRLMALMLAEVVIGLFIGHQLDHWQKKIFFGMKYVILLNCKSTIQSTSIASVKQNHRIKYKH